VWEPRCARLLLAELGVEQVADDPRRLALTLDRGGDDLVAQGIQGAGAVGEGSWPSLSASGVMMASGGPGW
jgi:hypothetical protein